MKERIYVLLPLLWSFLAGVALQRFVIELRACDPIHGILLYHAHQPDEWRFIGLIAGFLLLFLLPLLTGGKDLLKKVGRSGLPLLLSIPFLAVSTETVTPLLAVILCWCWALFRLGESIAPSTPLPSPESCSISRLGLLLAGAFALAGTWWGFHMQTHAWRAVFLLYQDWGEYATDYLRILQGPDLPLIRYFVAGGHWNPLPNLIMPLFLRILPAPETIFLLNALLIYSPVFLLYLLGRSMRLPTATSLFFSLMALFNPVISNQPLSLFYSYHPINMLPPLLILFFLFREQKNRIGMAITFLFSLLVQETVAILWFGYGLYLLFQRKWRSGAVLCFTMPILFLAISRYIIPEAADTEHYTQMFHFSQLGNTMTEVIFSPILNPRAFWGTLFERSNLDFLLALTLPMFFFLLPNPGLLLAALPLAAGVCLQSSRQMQNVSLWYGLEINTLIFLTALSGCALLFRNHDRRRIYGALLATLFGTASLYFFMGKSVFLGKYSYAPVAQLPEADKAIDFLKGKIPPGSTLLASSKIRSHFVFGYRSKPLTAEPEPGDFLLIDLNDSNLSPEELERLREKTAGHPQIAPITFLHWFNLHYALFRMSPAVLPPVRLPFLKEITEEEFAHMGKLVPLDDPDFEARLQYGHNDATLLIRLRRKVNRDANFLVDCGTQKREIPFAHGLRPAQLLPPGSTFLLPLPDIRPATPVQLQCRRRALPAPIKAAGPAELRIESSSRD